MSATQSLTPKSHAVLLAGAASSSGLVGVGVGAGAFAGEVGASYVQTVVKAWVKAGCWVQGAMGASVMGIACKMQPR